MPQDLCNRHQIPGPGRRGAAGPGLPARPGGAGPEALTYADLLGSSTQTAGSLRLFLMLTALSLIPLALACMTSFVRVVVVVPSMLRHALGLQETPPNTVLIGLALFLTLFSMQPTLQQVNVGAAQPFMQNRLSLPAALEKGIEPQMPAMARAMVGIGLRRAGVFWRDERAGSKDSQPLTPRACDRYLARSQEPRPRS